MTSSAWVATIGFAVILILVFGVVIAEALGKLPPVSSGERRRRRGEDDS